MTHLENRMGPYSQDIWNGISDPDIFCRENKPISTLVRSDWQQKPLDWENIKKVTPGTGMYTPGFQVGLHQIWEPHLLRNNMFLDIGCGPTALSCTQGRFVYGIDPHLPSPVLPDRAMVAVAEDLPFNDQTFDGIYSDKVVGFYPNYMDYWGAIREMMRVMKTKRYMVVRTGQYMTEKLYRETEKRVRKLGHEGRFTQRENFFLVYKENEQFEV